MIHLSQETEALAQRVAEAQHLSVDDAVKQALEEKARATGITDFLRPLKGLSPEAIAARRASIDKFVAEIAAMPILDPRSPQEIMDDLNKL